MCLRMKRFFRFVFGACSVRASMPPPRPPGYHTGSQWTVLFIWVLTSMTKPSAKAKRFQQQKATL